MMSIGLSTKKFTVIIEDLVKSKRLSYMDAVLHYCETHLLEPVEVTRYIDKSLKEKIQSNAEALNYLPKTSSIEGL